MRLTLLIPELVWPEPDDAETLSGLNCPNLCTLLARGHLSHNRHGQATFDAAVAECFGAGEHPAYAAVRLLGEGQSPEHHHWACADPVHLRFHQERLILADGATLSIETAEASQLSTSLNEYFADLGEFRVTAPERWYLRLAAEADFQTPPLSAMAGRRISQQLPEESRTAWLRKLLNEAQMLLHSHAVNEARENKGQASINSLWLWGPGKLPDNLPKVFDSVWSDHPLVRGFALCSGAACHDLPATFSDFMKQANPDKQQMISIESLLTTMQYENSAAWRQGMLDLESNWFAPLVKAIRAGKLSLDLRSSTVYGQLSWQVNRADMWRFWQGAQPLNVLAQKLALDSAGTS